MDCRPVQILKTWVYLAVLWYQLVYDCPSSLLTPLLKLCRAGRALLPCEGLFHTGLELRGNLVHCLLSLLEKARGSPSVLESSLIWLPGSSLTLADRLAGRMSVHLVPRKLELPKMVSRVHSKSFLFSLFCYHVTRDGLPGTGFLWRYKSISQ